MTDGLPELPFVNHQYDGDRMVANLCDVPDDAALQTAIFFETAAKKLRERHQIWKREQEIKRQNRSKMVGIRRMPGRLLDEMLNGHSFEEAARLIADNHGIPRETVYSYWLGAVGEIENRARHNRNKRVWELHQGGMSDEYISNEVALSSRQVRRIISKIKQQNENKAPQP